jgi:protein involved in polysaccharide export with SLBB domain
MNGDRIMSFSQRTSNRKPWNAVLACVLSFSLTACSTSRSQFVWHDLGNHPAAEPVQVSPSSQKWGQDSQGASVTDSQIAPGNLLSLHSSGDSKLNGDYRVDMDGSLQLPYNTKINTAGMSLTDLEKRLNEQYRPYFKTTPGMHVRLKERKNWVDVRGLVDKPGRYLVDPDASLDQVISTAGGYSKESMPRYVHIQKGSKNLTLDLNQYLNKADDRTQIAAWTGGETISLQKDMYSASPTSGYRLPIYVMGEVRKPGEFISKPGTDIVDLITQANGFTAEADLDRLELIRRTGGRELVYYFDWNNFNKAPTPMEGDVMLVRADHATHTERTILLTATVVTALATLMTTFIIADDHKF